MKRWTVLTRFGASLGEVVAGTHDAARGEAEARWPELSVSLLVLSVEGLEAVRRQMEARFRRNRRKHAHHEAGHAVLARRLGVPVLRVVIGPVMFRSGGRFHPDADSFGETAFGGDDLGPSPRTIILTMGGPMAEYRFRGREDWKVLNRRRLGGSDYELVDRLAYRLAFESCECSRRMGEGGFDIKSHSRCTSLFLEGIRHQAASLVDASWDRIEAVAAALLSRGELSGEDLDGLIEGPAPG